MHLIAVRNVNEAYQVAMQSFIDLEHRLKTQGKQVYTSSRVGQCLSIQDIVVTEYAKPRERILFDQYRNCNPFFHLMESLWILAGRKDVKFLDMFNSSLKNYSDHGHDYHAAYGFRLRKHFSRDQLVEVIKLLKEDPSSRRAVLQIWDAERDLNTQSLDIPCNDMIKLKIVNDRLDLIVFNRSNDMIWGAYGANVVQFSMLQEYLAQHLNVEVGKYVQISTDFHVYKKVFDKVKPFYKGISDSTEYHNPAAVIHDLVTDPFLFDLELLEWFMAPGLKKEYRNVFLSNVASPMYNAYYRQHSTGVDDIDMAIDYLAVAPDSDWKIAGLQWLQNKKQKRFNKNTEGL